MEIFKRWKKKWSKEKIPPFTEKTCKECGHTKTTASEHLVVEVPHMKIRNISSTEFN